ncbi:hypothetical protein L209DRAFT_758669 [Thermothelomyces heterothallicus CBS 203.75]
MDVEGPNETKRKGKEVLLSNSTSSSPSDISKAFKQLGNHEDEPSRDIRHAPFWPPAPALGTLRSAGPDPARSHQQA